MDDCEKGAAAEEEPTTAVSTNKQSSSEETEPRCTDLEDKPSSEVLAYEDDGEADADILAFIEHKYCTVCHLEQPLRTKHCRKCD